MNILNNCILILDNVLTSEECEIIIKNYEERGPSHTWGSCLPLSITTDDSVLFKYVIKILRSSNLPLNLNWGEVVKWPENSFMDYHFDKTPPDIPYDSPAFTSVTFLNNNFTGGETQFKDDFNICPKVGRTVFFNGKKYMHRVNKVIAGTRYTLPIWYTF